MNVTLATAGLSTIHWLGACAGTTHTLHGVDDGCTQYHHTNWNVINTGLTNLTVLTLALAVEPITPGVSTGTYGGGMSLKSWNGDVNWSAVNTSLVSSKMSPPWLWIREKKQSACNGAPTASSHVGGRKPLQAVAAAEPGILGH